MIIKHPRTAAQKHRAAERLSALLQGVNVRFEPSVSFQHDKGGVGNCYWVCLDANVFECGSSYLDARNTADGNLVTLLAASLQFQAERLTSAAVQLIEACKLDRQKVLEAVEREWAAEEAEKLHRQKGGVA